MADIKQAAKWANEGKRACRLAALSCEIYCNANGVLYRHSAYSIGDKPFIITTVDILADDWELAG
jgi:hypothetical protein